MLTYLLTKEDLTPEEVNGHAIDVVANGVDTVSVEKNEFNEWCSQSVMSSSLHDTLLTIPSSLLSLLLSSLLPFMSIIIITINNIT